MKRGQGAFEYLMSYGWAVLVVVVLGIVLYNLGAFSPSQAPVASGFSVIQPRSWSAASPNTSGTTYNISLVNAGGKDMTLTLSSVSVAKTGCTGSGVITSITDDSGTSLYTAGTTTSISLPAGGLIKMGVYSGASTGCNGASGQSFRVKFSLGTMTDTFGIAASDSGYLSGKYS
jgi:hypothetical protein